MVLVLYTSSNIPDCPYCDEARTWLNDNKVNFVEVDVADNQRLKDKIYEKTKSKSVPVVNIDGSYFRGWFTQKELKELLKLLKKN
jgi:glutaredoxin|tara:strand:+ start:229 stop:483 length:255 start_codon:yes stop_codon:yes gene_type:complete